jgi:hypothetical protein
MSRRIIFAFKEVGADSLAQELKARTKTSEILIDASL